MSGTAGQVGGHKPAIDLIGQAIVLSPNHAEVHLNLGTALRDKGQLDEAIAAYHLAITLKPDLPEAHFNLGVALQAKGHLDDALIAYQQAVALKPYHEQSNSI